MGSVLLDLLPLDAGWELPSALREEHQAVVDVREAIERVMRYGTESVRVNNEADQLGETYQVFGCAVAKMEKELRDARASYLWEAGGLPVGLGLGCELERSGDDLALLDVAACDATYHLSRCPTARLSDLRGLARSLRLMVMPLDAVSAQVLTGSRDFIDDGLYSFVGWAASLGLVVYVLGPIEAYSVGRHVTGVDLPPLYDPTGHPGLAGVQIMIPFLSELVRGLNALKKRVGKLENDKHWLSRKLEAAEAQLARIAGDIANDRDRYIREQAEQRGLLGELESKLDTTTANVALLSRRQRKSRRRDQEEAKEVQQAAGVDVSFSLPGSRDFCFGDPLAFVLPRGVDVCSHEGRVIVGACWGEEIDDRLLEAVGVARIAGQRAFVESRWDLPEWHVTKADQ